MRKQRASPAAAEASADTPADPKQAMRGEVRARIAAVKPFARAQRARALAATVLRSPALAGAKLVLAYRAMPDEIDVDAVVRALAAQGVRVAFPHVGDDGRLTLLEIASADPLSHACWTTDRYGIASPNLEAPAVRRVLARELDAALVPGRAFDRRGARLGRGKGFYDGLLGKLRPDARRATVGVCFREQLVDCVPEAGHDRRVAFLAVEGRLLRGARAGRGVGTASDSATDER